MHIGGTLFLLAIGAILAFAVQDRIDAVDLTTVGYILMAVGILGLILRLVLNTNRRTDDGGPQPPQQF